MVVAKTELIPKEPGAGQDRYSGFISNDPSATIKARLPFAFAVALCWISRIQSRPI
jgi:hypothetical protein